MPRVKFWLFYSHNYVICSFFGGWGGGGWTNNIPTANLNETFLENEAHKAFSFHIQNGKNNSTSDHRNAAGAGELQPS